MVEGSVRVPGDKSIAHRWLILAATARGRSWIGDLPPSLDVRSTARCLALLAPSVRPSLEGLTWKPARGTEPDGFTWDPGAYETWSSQVEVEAEGRDGLRAASTPLDCGNSGTTMRLLAGVLAGTGFTTTLTGDPSLRTRPMERVAEPLRRMGARVHTEDGHAPLVVEGAALRGIAYRVPLPSAQVKSAVLLAGLAAEGETSVREPAPTRDHTERILEVLGAPVRRSDGAIVVSAYQHGGLRGRVPGDVSSAAFLLAAAALTGGRLSLPRVGLNPTRTRFLEVMRRMGVRVHERIDGDELGEPIGELLVEPGDRPIGTVVTPDELPLVIDEVPVLAALAVHAVGPTRFAGAGELRVKESDRLAGLARMLR
ncbi:MAG TPA: 3-phosphoshikimate 1-carboxyvinyltransferase, partial [Actinomycetota bacterium]|nr:3-phosphoshikimate 1-carboxyvinyltransferase [Actinomycetota bacterium]